MERSGGANPLSLLVPKTFAGGFLTNEIKAIAHAIAITKQIIILLRLALALSNLGTMMLVEVSSVPVELNLGNFIPDVGFSVSLILSLYHETRDL